MSPRWAWGTAAAAERECPGGATEGKSGSGPRPRVPRSASRGSTRAWMSRRRRGRQPEAGRPRAATGARPPAGGAARVPPAPVGVGGGGGAERGARRQRPGPAARRAGERALAAARRPSASSSPGASGRVAHPRARRLGGYSGTRRVRACSDRELGAGRRSFLDGRLFCTEYSQNINHYFRTDSTICKLT